MRHDKMGQRALKNNNDETLLVYVCNNLARDQITGPRTRNMRKL